MNDRGNQSGLAPYKVKCPSCGYVHTTSSAQMVKFLEELIADRDALKREVIELKKIRR